MIDIRHGFAGGLAGIAVDIIFYPLDTIKTRIMASSADINFKTITLSKFKGFSSQMIVSFPYSFTFFYVYEQVRSLTSDLMFRNIIASVTAEITANLVRNPFEVVKQQMMVGRSHQIISSLRQIFNNRGVKGFYTGYRATILRDIVFSGCQLPLFQHLRFIIHHKYQLSHTTSASISGSIAACISGFISCPLDVLKTRHMTHDMKQNPNQMIKTIYNQSGIMGFFKGAMFRCSILSFGGIIYFGALQRARIILEIN